MTSTSFNIGMHLDRNTSRVLKPPGGGHTSLFGDDEVKVINPRPKHDQQNSSNMNFCMNTADPNTSVEQKKHEVSSTNQQQKPAEQKPAEQKPAAAAAPSQPRDEPQQGGRRVPPGGFSSGGFW